MDEDKKSSKGNDAHSSDMEEDDDPSLRYVKRPENAIASRKRSQRGAEEYFQKQREKKKAKRQAEIDAEKERKKKLRETLFEELKGLRMPDSFKKNLVKSTQLGISEKKTKDPFDDTMMINNMGNEDGTMMQELKEHEPDLVNVKGKKKQKKSKTTQSKHTFIVHQDSSDSESDSDDGNQGASKKEQDGQAKVEAKTEKQDQTMKDVPKPLSTASSSQKQTIKQKKSTPKTDAQLISDDLESSVKPEVMDSFMNASINTSKSTSIHINRPTEVIVARSLLPVVSMEQEIMESIRLNPVTVVCGETGSGKTTQIPQFLYEAGYASPTSTLGESGKSKSGIIAVTQPRRVAAVSMARRVAHELGTLIPMDEDSVPESTQDGKVEKGSKRGFVGYKVRYDGQSVWKGTKILFMTDGVLLREAREDVLLRKYSVIVLDEAHERNLNTDFIIGILSRIVPLREKIAKEGKMKGVEPLKVVIMSATLRVEDFTLNRNLFDSLYKYATSKLKTKEKTKSIEDLFKKKDKNNSSNVDGDKMEVEEEEDDDEGIPGLKLSNKMTVDVPPIIKVDARQHPVTAHFSRRTELKNYLSAVFKKVCAIHKRLPPGGILVFLTGEREIDWFCQKLRKKFPKGNMKGSNQDSKSDMSTLMMDPKAREMLELLNEGEDDEVNDGGKVDGGFTGDLEYSDLAATATMENKNSNEIQKSESNDDNKSEITDYSDIDSDEGGDDDKSKEIETEIDHDLLNQNIAESEEDLQKMAESSIDETPVTSSKLLKMNVLPLYSRLPTKKQLLVFQKPEDGSRLVVVATNVAETSITIPGIKYVVDSGREKRREVDPSTNISLYKVGWISQASANQRMGRAGRVGPGHCYRLYSAAVFHNHLKQFSDPEILRRPIEDVVLYAKTLGIHHIENFPFPTPPDPVMLRTALRRLENLGAIEPGSEGKVTSLGNRMAKFPVPANIAKVLVIATTDPKLYSRKDGVGNLIPHAIALAAGLSVQSPFLSNKQEASSSKNESDDSSSSDDENKKSKSSNAVSTFASTSDSLALLKAIGAYLFATNTANTKKPGSAKAAGEKLCKETGLHQQSMEEISKLRSQLVSIASPIIVELRQKNSKMNNSSSGSISYSDHVEKIRKSLMEPLRMINSIEENIMLEQLVATGFLDRIARKMDRDEARSVLDGKHPKRTRWPYEVCDLNISSNEPCYISTQSNVYSRDSKELPAFCVFQEIVKIEKRKKIYKLEDHEKMQGKKDGEDDESRIISLAQSDDPKTSKELQKLAKEKLRKLMLKARNSKKSSNDDSDNEVNSDSEDDEEKDEYEIYTVNTLRGITPIRSEWLWSLSKGTNMCDFSSPLEDPPPTYDKAHDTVMCSISPIFGPKRWSLIPIRVSYDELIERNATAVSKESSLLKGSGFETGPLGRTNWFARLLMEGKIIPELAKIITPNTLAMTPAHITRMHHQPRVSMLVSTLLQNKVKNKSSLISLWKQNPTALEDEIIEWIRKEERESFRKSYKSIIESIIKSSNI